MSGCEACSHDLHDPEGCAMSEQMTPDEALDAIHDAVDACVDNGHTHSPWACINVAIRRYALAELRAIVATPAQLGDRPLIERIAALEAEMGE